MAFLLVVLVVAVLAFLGWRLMKVASSRPRTRMIGPDDDPDFLRRLGREDKPQP